MSKKGEFDLVKGEIEAIIAEVDREYAEVSTSPQTRSAPMAVSILLRCIHKVRGGLELLSQMTSKQQEDLAWMHLNCCKMIIEIGQPLVWTSCGKYIVVSVMYAISCMENVINLCTWRHLQFRLKLYSTAFYGALTQLGVKEAQNILNQLKQQLSDLRDRESLDLPMPERVECVLAEAEIDAAVMGRTLSFWKDPDSLRVAENAAPAVATDAKPEKGKSGKPSAAAAAAAAAATAADVWNVEEKGPDPATYVCETAKAVVTKRWFGDRVLSECARVQQLTSGNPNEMWKKRLSSVVRAFWAVFESVDVALYSSLRVSDASSTSESSEAKPKLTMECLTVVAMLMMFGVVEGIPIGEVLTKIWSVVDKLVEPIADEERAHTDTVERAFNKYLSPAETKALVSSNCCVDPDCIQALVVLRNLARVIDAVKIAESSQSHEQEQERVLSSLTTSLTDAITALLYSDDSFRKQSLLHRVAISIWSKYVYGRLQSALNSKDGDDARVMKTLHAVAKPLLTSVQVLDVTFIEDPLLMASLSTLSATVLHEIGDLRGSIALLKRAIEVIDIHRSNRVDVSMHLPSDARDIQALQRASITADRDEIDWFHGVKRLGAHAFAGFGIFGAGSSTDPTDLALADAHADAVALYFRYELENSIQEYYIKKQWKENAAKAAAIEASKSELAKALTKKTKSHSPTRTSAVMTSTTSVAQPVNSEKLSCVQALRAMCSKNSYMKCILLIEMALVDTDTTRKTELLEEARSCIVEVETREAALIECLNDLSIVAADGRSKAPIVLARSHRSIYVAPVASQKQLLSNPPIKYFRVLAKEQGSGTEVTLSNDYIGGTEKKIDISTYSNPTAGYACLQPLRPGERYVFGCAAFGADDEVIGAVSPTTIAVEAVNPLSTVVLWGFMNTVAARLKLKSLAIIAAQAICSRYFDYSNPLNLRCIGKGVNIHIDEEPILCMLAVEKSSPMALQYFVSAFLSLEDKLFSPVDTSDSNSAVANSTKSIVAVHWDNRRALQSHLITSIRKAAIVANIASQLRHHELIVRAVCLGYSLCSQLFVFDEMHLSSYVLPSLLVFIVSLQFVPKRHWHSLEHSLYCRLLAHACKLSVFSRNTSPMSVLLLTVYSEAKDAQEALVPSSAEEEYCSLLRSIGIGNRILLPPLPPAVPAATTGKDTKNAAPVIDSSLLPTYSAVETDLLELLTAASKHAADAFLSTDFLWHRVSLGKQPAFGFGLAALLSAAESNQPSLASNLYRWLREKPVVISAMLAVVSGLCQELGAQKKGDRIAHLLNRVLMYDRNLAPLVQDIIKPFRLKFVLAMPSPEEQADAANAAAQAAAQAAAANVKGAKKGAPVEEPVIPTFTAEQFAIPKAFVEADANEVQKQLLFLGTITSAIATCCYSDGKNRNYYPKNKNGPMQNYEPNNLVHLQLADDINSKLASYVEPPEPVPAPAEPAAAQAPAAKGAKAAAGSKTAAAEEAPAPLPVPLQLVTSRNDFIRYTCMSTILLAKSFSVNAAIGACVKLWNVIVDSWCDPATFAADAVPVKPILQDAIYAILVQLELLLGSSPILASASSAASSTTAIGMDEGALLVQLAVKAFEGDATLRSPRTLKVWALQLRDLLVFVVKVWWLYKDYKTCVDIGSRVVDIYIAMAPEFGKALGYSILPLVKHAQERIIDQCAAHLDARKQSLADCINNFEELMKKKRRKKLRIARLEKDEDELAFEAERDGIQALVDEADGDLQANIRRLDDLEVQDKLFKSQYGTGLQLLDKVRVTSNEIVSDAMTELLPEDRGDIRCVFARNREIVARVELVLEQYTKVGHFLREKKDRITLIEMLKEQSDFLLLFGKFNQAKLILFDVVDGFFNVMDAVQNWTHVVEKCLPAFDYSQLVSGVVPVVVALGKLSRYTAPRDWDLKSNCCRLASEICRLAMDESYGHPQTLVGLAAYECRELGGLGALTFNVEKLNAVGICVALAEIIEALHAEQLFIEQLPLLVLLEHFHAVYTRMPELWLAVRLKRLRALISAHLFAEAASMLAAILPSVHAIADRSYDSPLHLPSAAMPTSRAGFDTSPNGLDFHGRAPFFNHLPPHSDANKQAMSWIESFPNEFKEFAKEHRVRLPEVELTDEERAARNAAREEALAAAQAAAAKDKKASKKAPAVVAAEEQEANAADAAEFVDKFDSRLIAELFLVCGAMHLELAQMDGRAATTHSPSLAALATSGQKLVNSSLEQLGASASVSTAALPVDVLKHDGVWMSLYCRAKLLLSTAQVSSRDYKAAKASLLAFLQTLQGFLLPKNTAVYYPPNAPITPLANSPGNTTIQTPLSMAADVQFAVAQSWSASKQLLISIAERQSRLSDAVAMSTNSAKDASRLLSSFWLIDSLLARVRANYKLGNLAESEVDCNAALDLCEQRHFLDQRYIQLLILRASILRERSMTASCEERAKAWQSGLHTLRKARATAESSARRYGFVGADSNTTFFRTSSTELAFERLPPLLHNISEIHCNEPKLSLKPRPNEKLLLEVLPTNARAAKLSSALVSDSASVSASACADESDVDSVQVCVWNGRLGPVTRDESALTESEYCNVYLASVRQLSTAHASLAWLLMEVLASSATVEDEPVAVNSGSNSSSGSFARPVTARQKEIAQESNRKFQLFAKSRLTRELIAIAEDGLKVLYHVVYASAFIKIVLMLASGKTRRTAIEIAGSEPFTSRANNPSLNVGEILLNPLRTALEMGVFGSVHPWQYMRSSCIELVDLFGDATVPIDLDPDMRLKLATMHLITAIKVGEQSSILKGSILDYCAATPALNSAASADLSALLASVCVTSAPVAADDSASAQPSGKSKGAAGKTAAPAGQGGLGPTGRDVLNLLVTVQREANPLYSDGFEFDLWSDLHNLLKAEYEPYRSRLSLMGVPDMNATLTISASSISTLYVPTKQPADFVNPDIEEGSSRVDSGLFTHVLMYILLGPRQSQVADPVPAAVDAKAAKQQSKAAGSAAAVASEAIGEPILTKALLYRPHMLTIAAKLNAIRDKLREAIAKDWVHSIDICAAELGATLCQLVGLIKYGYITSADPSTSEDSESQNRDRATESLVKQITCTFEVMSPSSSRSYPLVRVCGFTEEVSCLVPVNDECIAKFLSVLTFSKDVDSILDNDVCTFYRYSLGYIDL